MAAVKPFWQSRTDEEKVQLLTISLEELRQRANELTEARGKPGGMSHSRGKLFGNLGFAETVLVRVWFQVSRKPLGCLTISEGVVGSIWSNCGHGLRTVRIDAL